MRMEAVPPRAVTERRVAVLIDGENIAPGAAEPALRVATDLGRAAIRRVYRDAAHARGWEAAAGFRTVHTGTAGNKNAADMALAIEAVALALRGQADAFVLVTSDGDFTALACWLRENGFSVIGVGEAKAPPAFRAACDRFLEVAPAAPKPVAKPAPTPPAQAVPACPPQAKPKPAPDPSGAAKPSHLTRVDAVLNPAGGDGWLPFVSLCTQLNQQKLRPADTGHATWRSLLSAHPDRYELEPKGTSARVRLRQRAP
jgi:hypothetical protein